MKILYLFLALLLAASPLFAQSDHLPGSGDSTGTSDRATWSPPVPPPNLYLKTNIFSLAEPDVAATISVEYRRDKKLAYQLEAGYIFLDAFEYGENLIHTYGFRLKPEWRFYTPGSSRKQAHYSNYWAAEAIIKAVYNRLHGFVGRQCASGNCAYYQEMDYGTARNVVGIGGKVGRETYLGREARRVILDFYVGLGVRYRWLNNSLPPDAEKHENNAFLQMNRPTMFLPYLSAGIKIGWRIK